MDVRKKLNISQGKFASLVVLLALVVILPILLLVIKQRIRVAPRADIGVAQMFFAAPTYSLAPNGTVSVLLDPAGNLVGFAEVQVNFDKTKVQLESNPVIPVGNPLSTHIVVDSKDNANANGVINMTLALPPGTAAPTSTFEYAQLSFTAVNTDSDTMDLTISSGRQLWETGGSAVSYTTQNTSLELNPAGPTATPEPTQEPGQPTNTPTPSHTPVPTNTPGPTSTPGPTATPGAGPTNACGGTCGSNANCNTGLTCYAGFCRNPACNTAANCSCPGAPTATPSPRPTTPPGAPTSTTAPQATPTTGVISDAQPTLSDNPLLGGAPRTDVDVPEITYETEQPAEPQSWWESLLSIITNFLRIVFGFR